MRTYISYVFLAALLAFSQAKAQTSASTQLRTAATGARFNIGETAFRMVPNAIAVRQPKNPAANPKTLGYQPSTVTRNAASSTAPIGYVGPYAIIMPKRGNFVPQASRVDLARGGGELAVAINESSGQPVLVTPRVKLFVVDAALVNQLALSTGGSTIYASDVDGAGLIEYPTIEKAQDAQAKIHAEKGVEDAYLDIIQTIYEKN